MGRVYQPSYNNKKTGALRKGAVWWIEYWHNGERERESSESRIKSDAVDLLKRRLGEAGIGKLLPRAIANTTFDDLKKLVSDDYKVNDRDSSHVQTVLNRLASAFEGMKAVEITVARIETYKGDQKDEGYANATINRDLAALKRAFRLGHRTGVVAQVPPITMLTEDNVRKGFFEPQDFKKFLGCLSDELRPLYRVAYITGWRVQSELLTRQWQHVDFTLGKLRIDPGETKNKDGREFPFTKGSELETVLEEQHQRAERVEKERGISVGHVFFAPDGSPVSPKDHRKGWKQAATLSGVGRLPHDLRRTAVRNLEMAGVPRVVAMKLVGHKTESIYRRYSIVEEGWIQDAAKRLATFQDEQAAALQRKESADTAPAAPKSRRKARPATVAPKKP
jgi:integrase